MLGKIKGARSAIRDLLSRARYRARYHIHEMRNQLSEHPSESPQFGIRAGYRHRYNNEFFDDTLMTEHWQKEVYDEVAGYAARIGARTVMDVGCGSAFKLLKHFHHLHTIGLDLEPTLSFLRSSYPDRTWLASDFADAHPPAADVVICSDVIEHIPDPDALMGFLQRIPARRWFISTPERRLVYGWDHSGPPLNHCHCREWTLQEFSEYASRWFSVVEAKVTNRTQGTQMLALERGD